MIELRRLAWTLGLLLPLPALAAETLLVEVPARLDKSAPITEAARMECQIPALVGNHVLGDLQARMGMGVSALQGAEPASGKVLRLTVLSARGVGGGSWSGPKFLTVRADLVEGGKVLGGFTAHRGSRGGMWGGMTGTCPIFERIAVALGKDIGSWAATAVWHGTFTPPSMVEQAEEAAPIVEPAK
ncbi:MAG TPA: hypothetical protein VFH35_03635 [Ramlibacter sp.]|nr:hypothetical protein [Ramlibacter sp.]